MAYPSRIRVGISSWPLSLCMLSIRCYAPPVRVFVEVGGGEIGGEM